MKTLCCDVGSGSVRCAILEYENVSSTENVLQTKPLAVATEPIPLYNAQVDFYEQKTEEIWRAFCKCTSQCLQQCGLSTVVSDSHFPIEAIAFSATCSLVIVEKPRTDGTERCDVIMWMDHRAKEEAEIINKSGHDVLNQFGGTCSPEFSLAKLFWLYRNDRPRFDAAHSFMELSDWLTYRCSQFFGTPTKFPRSLCSVVCKWGYDAKNCQWRSDLFNLIGMPWEDSLRDRIGSSIIIPGVRAASLSAAVACEIGFTFERAPTGTSIDSVALASSLIDAHAGVISMLVFGNRIVAQPEADKRALQGDLYENIFCMISGTSTCQMILNKLAFPTRGVWGPYLGAIIPGYYLREAGQSATGKLIEKIILWHYDGKLPSSLSQIIVSLNEQLQSENFDHKTSLIVNPSFHGNRSPIANPSLKGAIYGFSLEKTDLLDLYVSTVEAIAYETRFIVEEIEKHGQSNQKINRIIVSGGLAKNELYLQLHADVLGVELITFSAGEADLMLVGASVIALTAAQIKPDDDPSKLTQLLDNLRADPTGFKEHFRVYKPRQTNTEYHQRKYKCYRRLLDCGLEIENILSS